MLKQPERRKHEQPSGADIDSQAEVTEFGLTAFADVVEIPQKNLETFAFLVGGVEMRVKAFVAAGSISPDAQCFQIRAFGYRKSQPQALVVRLQILSDLVAKIPFEGGVCVGLMSSSVQALFSQSLRNPRPLGVWNRGIWSNASVMRVQNSGASAWSNHCT